MSIYEYTPALVYFTVLAFFLGAAAGSFLNCAAWRITHGESFTRGRSHCPDCGHTLGFWDLIPILSWLALRGRCRYCGGKISVRYPLTELFFAIVTVLCLWRFDLSVICLRNFLYLCSLFLLSLTDLTDMTIPDGCHIAGILVWAAAAPLLPGFPGSAGWSVLSMVLYGGALLLLSVLMDRVLGRESMGGGDIKLVGVSALYLGPVGTLFMIILASVMGLAGHGLSGGKRSQPFPFGPWLAAATAVMLFVGDPLVRWYLGLLGIR